MLLPPLNTATIRKFWARVNKISGHGPWGDCWLWTGYRNEHDYGRFKIAGRNHPAHVVAWALANGRQLPPSKPCGLHRCDNRPCCNPAHIFPGTKADNTADMMAKGRHSRGGRPLGSPVSVYLGEENYSAKLTAPEVLEIRRRLADGERRLVLAGEFGVSRECVRDIANRKAWAHVPAEASA